MCLCSVCAVRPVGIVECGPRGLGEERRARAEARGNETAVAAGFIGWQHVQPRYSICCLRRGDDVFPSDYARGLAERTSGPSCSVSLCSVYPALKLTLFRASARPGETTRMDSEPHCTTPPSTVPTEVGRISIQPLAGGKLVSRNERRQPRPHTGRPHLSIVSPGLVGARCVAPATITTC